MGDIQRLPTRIDAIEVGGLEVLWNKMQRSNVVDEPRATKKLAVLFSFDWESFGETCTTELLTGAIDIYFLSKYIKHDSLFI